jgi:squalene cyclase
MSARANAPQNAIAVGLDYVLSIQADDGSWTEWALPPGSSTPWTTAYVGYKLRSLPAESMARATPHLADAAHWMGANAFAGGGWGYNALVGSDADSTAYAILFLASASQPVPEAAYARLASFQNPDGGFATYPRTGLPDSWHVSHPDVTPMALLALLTHPAASYHGLIRRGTEYVLRQRTAQGLWNSFWWHSCLYGAEASLTLLNACDVEMPSPAGLALIEPANAFEAALLVSALLYARGAGWQAIVRDLADRLMGEQQPDGSWQSAPILRITQRDCYEPWACSDAGPLYADPNRLFTTATVLHALSRVSALTSRDGSAA